MDTRRRARGEALTDDALESFDPAAGSRLERLVFDHRPAVVLLAALLTLVLGTLAVTRHRLNADYEKTRPTSHPFVRTWLEHRGELRGLGNVLQVVVEPTGGDVWDPGYLETLRQVTDELFLTPGVDRAWVRSLWLPTVRWTEVTEEGFRGGPVMPDDYDGSPRAVEALRRNVARAGVTGSVVADDGRSTAVWVPLLDRDPVTGAGIDYPALSARLEALRARVEGPDGGGSVRLRVVGFAKLVGDLLAGLRAVTAWFVIAAAISAAALYLYTRCWRSTALVLGCSAVAVLWQAGLMAALRLALDPFSVLVPFLVFSLGVSHGAQKTNGILQDVGRGATRLLAARRTFRRLFRAGLTALLTDMVGFGVLAVVDVPVIRELAFTASAGVGILIFTNLVLLPVLLSYAGVSPAAAARSLRAGLPRRGPWAFVGRLTERRRAIATLVVAAGVVTASALLAGDLQVGDLDAGAPELRPGSRYNRDGAYVAAHYGRSSDVFAVVVSTPPEGCLAWETLVEADRLAAALREVPGVQATAALPDAVRRITAGSFEGNPRWLTVARDRKVLDYAVAQATARDPDLVNAQCSVAPVVAWLADHRAATLDAVVGVADGFARAHSTPERRFLLAAGSAGMEAATNLVVRDARWTMTLLVYGAVLLLCLATLRSWRATLVTMIPLAATSVACGALMAALGIGMKVTTLPVIALGVGIPDFALYLLTIQLAHQRAGEPLGDAWRSSLAFTGRVVALVSVTLAASVVTWAWSPIRLQADMGLLLTFMFLGNMVAALALVPALSAFLLPGRGPEGSRP